VNKVPCSTDFFLQHTQTVVPHLSIHNFQYDELVFPLLKGISSPRRAANGEELPSPRLVSTTVVGAEDRELSDITLVLMSWGQ